MNDYKDFETTEFKVTCGVFSCSEIKIKKEDVVDSKCLETEDYIISCKRESEDDFLDNCDIKVKEEGQCESEHIEYASTVNGNQSTDSAITFHNGLELSNKKSEININGKKTKKKSNKQMPKKEALQTNVFIGENLFKCEMCKHKFIQKDDFEKHLQVHKIAKTYKCTQCTFQTNRMGTFKTHLIVHNDARPYKCGICKKTFKWNHCLKLHNLTHTKEKLYNCTECSHASNSKLSIASHYQNKHLKGKEKQYKCSQCSFETHTIHSLKTHLKRHLSIGNQIFKCSQCSYETKMKRSLIEHAYSHHNMKKPFECNICHKGYVQKHYLQDHMESKHLDTKEYKCLQCNYRTYVKRYLKLHLTKHNKNDSVINVDEKKFHCTHCNFKTKHKNHLLRHTNIKHCGENE